MQSEIDTRINKHLDEMNIFAKLETKIIKESRVRSVKICQF
jgi:hypothetical protein